MIHCIRRLHLNVSFQLQSSPSCHCTVDDEAHNVPLKGRDTLQWTQLCTIRMSALLCPKYTCFCTVAVKRIWTSWAHAHYDLIVLRTWELHHAQFHTCTVNTDMSVGAQHCHLLPRGAFGDIQSFKPRWHYPVQNCISTIMQLIISNFIQVKENKTKVLPTKSTQCDKIQFFINITPKAITNMRNYDLAFVFNFKHKR